MKKKRFSLVQIIGVLKHLTDKACRQWLSQKSMRSPGRTRFIVNYFYEHKPRAGTVNIASCGQIQTR